MIPFLCFHLHYNAYAGAILQLLETKGISISLRTYYVHRDEAIEVLSSILWGYTSQDCEKITNLLTPD